MILFAGSEGYKQGLRMLSEGANALVGRGEKDPEDFCCGQSRGGPRSKYSTGVYTL